MWNNQTNNAGTDVKLVVYYHDDQAETKKTFWAFRSEEIKGTAIDGLVKRILMKLAFGRYKLAIIYDTGKEVQRWTNGIRTQ